MPRVLLLADDDVDLQSRRAIESLHKSLAGEFDVHRHVLRSGPAGWAGFWRWRRSHDRPIDLVIAVGTRALTAACLGLDGPVLFSFASFASRHDIRWLRAAMACRDIHLICPTVTARRFCIERGVPIERCHLIRPGVDFSRIRRRRDAAFRASLGLAESDFVFLLPGEETAAANFRAAVWAISILNVAQPRYRLLSWGRGPRAAALRRFAARLNQPDLIVTAEQHLGRSVDFGELFPAVDGVLITAGGSVPVLPVATCMAAGLPIVSTVTSEISELLEDRHTALLVARTTPRAIAQRILDLRADSRMQWSISDMARTEAFNYFAQSRFVDQYRTMVRQVLAGESVMVTEPAPGAGMRFHGLA